MKIIPPGFTLLDAIDAPRILKKLERVGRVCWKSEERITEDSHVKFLDMLIKKGHESVIEHESLSVGLVCDRGITHELVRHRIASYTQESTRYCNYAKNKFDGEITFIRPFFWDDDHALFAAWKAQMQQAEDAYLQMISQGATAQEARAVLPHSVKAEIIVTMNLRAWRHFFKQRTPEAAHPQMREVAQPLLAEFQRQLPVIFGDL